MNYSLFLLLLFTLNTYFTNAFIEWAIRWEKEENNTCKSILGLADRHLTSFFHLKELAKVNFEQHEAILSFFSQQQQSLYPPQIIIEDITHYEGPNPVIKKYCDKIAANTIQTIHECSLKEQLLLNLLHNAKEHKLNTSNVEFHFAQLVALSLLKKYALPTSEVIEEFNKTTDNVRSFDDGQRLNQLYQEHLDAIEEPSKEVRKQLSTFSGTMKDYLKKNIPKPKKWGFIRAFRFFDVRLKDMLALHEIATTDKSKVILLMGKGHIKMLDSFITQHLGYTKKSVIGKEDEGQKEYPTFNFEIEALPDPDLGTDNDQDDRNPLSAEQLTAFLFEE